MTTKADLIKQIKTENPEMISIINGEEIKLSKAEYEKACEDWATMRLEQLKLQAEELAKATAKAALLEKLGITAEEAALLLG
jgi:sulfur carrier protein ThiS